MPKVALYNISGAKIGEIEVSQELFGQEVNQDILHEVVVAHLANARQGTQSALTRAEVRGGGIKPWRQKGTGRARQGSIRSPQWKHGGIVFAPKPRDYSKSVNKKVRRLALKSALSSKYQANELIVVDNLCIAAPKTKEMVKVLGALKASKALVVTVGRDEDVVRACANIQGIKTASASLINTYDILKYDKFIITQAALDVIQEVYA